MTASKNYILNQALAEKKMRRMALEIIENNPDDNFRLRKSALMA